MSKWYDEAGPENDVVISSRIRLARNFSSYKFPSTISEEDAKAMVNSVVGKFQQDLDEKYKVTFMNSCSESKRNALKEKRIISSYLVKNNNGAVLLSEDEGCAVLVNDEDHIRIQTLANGMNILKCFKVANQIDDYIDSNFDYAFDEKYGYKTTFPTNVGTGLRAGYTLHLPGLCEARKIAQIANELGRFGIKIKQIYGDSENAYGNLYQVSSQKTLGHSETEIIKDLDDIVAQIINQEREQRRYFYEKDRFQAEDMAYKSYGVLKYARKMSLRDSMTLLSELMLGISLGIVVTEQPIPFNKIIMDIQPAVISNISQKALSVEESDVLRAEYIRNNLPNIN